MYHENIIFNEPYKLLHLHTTFGIFTHFIDILYLFHCNCVLKLLFSQSTNSFHYFDFPQFKSTAYGLSGFKT